MADEFEVTMWKFNLKDFEKFKSLANIWKCKFAVIHAFLKLRKIKWGSKKSRWGEGLGKVSVSKKMSPRRRLMKIAKTGKVLSLYKVAVVPKSRGGSRKSRCRPRKSHRGLGKIGFKESKWYIVLVKQKSFIFITCLYAIYLKSNIKFRRNISIFHKSFHYPLKQQFSQRKLSK